MPARDGRSTGWVVAFTVVVVLAATGLLLCGAFIAWSEYDERFNDTHSYVIDVSDLVVVGSDPTSPWKDAEELAAHLRTSLGLGPKLISIGTPVGHPTQIAAIGTMWGKWRVEDALDELRATRHRP